MNNILNIPLDLKKSCTLYSASVRQSLHDLLNIDVGSEIEAKSVNQLDQQEDLYFSILFTGQIYGEFLFGLNKKTALDILHIGYKTGEEELAYWKNRNEILDTFKEIINIAAGTTLGQLRSAFPELSITPPKAIEGRLTLSSYEIERTQLLHSSGKLSCYIYIDHMKLDISDSLEKNKRLNKAKSEFLANMSHELRTPLNGMIGMLDILKRSTFNPVQKEQFDVIYRSGEFLLSIISDVLEFSKIESGKLEIENKAFDLRRAIDSVAESMSVAVLGRGLDFNIQVSPAISGQYEGDETRLKQVLINLIGNAVKFTPTGSVTLTAEADDQRIAIRIIDTGIGIPVGKLEQIFESFSQADVSDNRKYGGTGLGLTISKSIVKAMGGTISVKSEEAKGTEFLIDLPLKLIEGTAKPLVLDSIKNSSTVVITRNQQLFETINSYVDGLSSGHDLKCIEDLSSKFMPKSTYFVDFQTWQTLEAAKQNKFLESAKHQGTYVVFIAMSKDLDAINQIQKQFELERCYFLNLPITLTKLAEVLGKQPVIKTKVEVVEPKDTDTDPAKRTILVVEDNKVNQIVITTMLKQLGYKYDVVDDGKMAVKQVADGRKYDLILMDCQMPIMDGYEATKHIRQIESSKEVHVPIIALTANAFRETKEACFDCGMDDFATKPFTFDGIKALLKKSFSKY